MSYTNSKTWVSDKTATTKAWKTLSNRLSRMFYSNITPVPWTQAAYLDHRRSMVEHHKDVSERKVKALSRTRIDEERGQTEYRMYDPARKPLWLQAKLDGFYITPGKGAFFYMDTIWCLNPDPARESAMYWPQRREYKHEGDERAAKQFGRFFPLPREWNEDNLYAPFQKVDPLPMYPFDEIYKKPTYEDIYIGPEEVYEKDGVHMLGKHLLEYMDDDLNFN